MSAVTAFARPAAARSPARAPRTAFVLAGGAALGAMQAGMVHALCKRGITPDLLIGTSAGALNGSLAPRPATAATAEEPPDVDRNAPEAERQASLSSPCRPG
jgi:NTE family protein